MAGHVPARAAQESRSRGQDWSSVNGQQGTPNSVGSPFSGNSLELTDRDSGHLSGSPLCFFFFFFIRSGDIGK